LASQVVSFTRSPISAEPFPGIRRWNRPRMGKSSRNHGRSGKGRRGVLHISDARPEWTQRRRRRGSLDSDRVARSICGDACIVVGVADANLSGIFPNLTNFGTAKLAFLWF
jgi:hypothetical protein